MPKGFFPPDDPRRALQKPKPRLAKSGDSARQDAEKAREMVQQAGADMSPRERLEVLPELLQDSVDKKKEQGATQEELDRTRAALAQLTATLGATLDRLSNLEKKAALGAPSLTPDPEPLRCGTCKQVIQRNGKGICTGEHVQILVFPRDRYMASGFQHVTRNGVDYFGYCLVPPSMADDILAAVNSWTDARRMLGFDRGVMRDDPWTRVGARGQGGTPAPIRPNAVGSDQA